MSSYLNELRKKPKHIRDNIAFAIAGGCTLVVAGVAIVTGSFAHSTLATEEGSERTPMFATFFSQIKEQAASAVSTVKREDEPTTNEVAPTQNLIDISAFEAEPASTPKREVPIIVVPTASTTDGVEASTTPNVVY